MTNREAIKQGKLQGREALLWLAEYGDYVFHGSGIKIPLLEPRQAFNFNHRLQKSINDGKPAICASYEPETAIFMALVNPVAAKILNEHCNFSYHNGVFAYRASRKALRSAKKSAGYIHVFSKKSLCITVVWNGARTNP